MKSFIGLLSILLASGIAWAGAQETDLINLARSGVDQEILSAYIEKANGPYHLTTDQIVELKNLGVSSTTIAEAIKHETPENPSAAIIGEKSPEAPAVAEQDSPSAPATTTAPAASAAAGTAPPPEVVAPAESDQNISFFYQALNPYGTWIVVDGSWCWRPYAAGVNVAWSPYFTNGYWTYTDWGWTWVSNYSWGWAPFHYGRWFRHAHYGWMWEPGTEWGPAWVSWRTGDDYFGWAPLPCHARFVEHQGIFFNGRLAVGGVEFGLTIGDYFFVPSRHFADRDVWRYGVGQGERGGFFNRTTFVRDNYRFDHDRIFNAGPSRDRVEHFTHRNIQQVTLVPEHLKPGERIHGGFQRERELVIYKPAISRAAPLNPIMVHERMQRSPNNPGQRHETYMSPQPRNDRGAHGSPGFDHRRSDNPPVQAPHFNGNRVDRREPGVVERANPRDPRMDRSVAPQAGRQGRQENSGNSIRRDNNYPSQGDNLKEGQGNPERHQATRDIKTENGRPNASPMHLFGSMGGRQHDDRGRSFR